MSDKPREWAIYPRGDGWAVVMNDERTNACSNVTYVVERSAYEAAIKELVKLMGVHEISRMQLTAERNTIESLRREIFDLKFDLREDREKLKRLYKIESERDEARAKVTALELLPSDAELCRQVIVLGRKVNEGHLREEKERERSARLVEALEWILESGKRLYEQEISNEPFVKLTLQYRNHKIVAEKALKEHSAGGLE